MAHDPESFRETAWHLFVPRNEEASWWDSLLQVVISGGPLSLLLQLLSLFAAVAVIVSIARKAALPWSLLFALLPLVFGGINLLTGCVTTVILYPPGGLTSGHPLQPVMATARTYLVDMMLSGGLILITLSTGLFRRWRSTNARRRGR